ncbi:MAG: polyphosphate kinase 2 [Candidatus Binatia bacterium]
MSKKKKKDFDKSSDSPRKLKRKEFERELVKLQVELCHLQAWVKHKGLRVVVVFEGRDAAGKGGVIKRITERVSPRVFQVVALPTPSERERTQMYFQRYMNHMPAAGEIMLFDRSWYNRAGVERVMGFCTDKQYEQFLDQCPLFEGALVRDGIKLVKYFFEVNQKEQERRFIARATDPLRHWKLSPMDVESWRRWWHYTAAYERMIKATNTEQAPWYRVNANNKRRARLNCMEHLLSLIPYKRLPFKPPNPGKRKKRPRGLSDSLPFTHEVPEVW